MEKKIPNGFFHTLERVSFQVYGTESNLKEKKNLE